MTQNELLTRGVEQVVPGKGLREKMERGEKIRLYLGIDPTGAALTLGHAIPLRKLRDFQNAGHEVILLVGNFTALIGDTSDKDAMRPPITMAQIEANFKTYKKQAGKILDFDKSKIMYNGDWLSKLKFEDIVKLAQHFTVQQMIQRDMYQERLKLDKPIGYHEFLYPLMQGYDSVAMEVDLEVGGSDQLFNMLAGRTLLKAMKNKEKWVLTTPLIEGLDGRKMSKSYGNTVNITDEPSDMFGKIMSISDALIIRYFLLCTDVPLREVDEIDSHIKSGGNPRDAKARLAGEIVKMYHSAKAAESAEAEFKQIFQKGGVPDDMPEFKLSGSRNIIDLILECKLAPSKNEARRLIEQGGVKVNDEKVADVNAQIPVKKDMIIQVGKRRFAKIA